MSRPCYLRLTGEHEVVAGDIAGLAAQLAAMTADGALRRTVAIRYRGQAHHLDIPVIDGLASLEALEKTLRGFEDQYESLFGSGAGFREAGFELTGLRVIATRGLGGEIPAAPSDDVVQMGSWTVVFDDPAQPVRCPIHRTAFPAPGRELRGPCLVVFPGQTLVVPPGATARTDEAGNFVVELGR